MQIRRLSPRARAYISRWFFWISISIAALAGGCGGAALPPMVIGPYATPPDQTFQTVLAAAQSRGYVPLEADPSLGVILFASQHRQWGPTFIRVQCWSGGWVQVVPDGPVVRRQGERFILPGPLYLEVRDFAIALRRTTLAGAGS